MRHVFLWFNSFRGWVGGGVEFGAVGRLPIEGEFLTNKYFNLVLN